MLNAEESYLGPKDLLEEQLTVIWEDVLRRKPIGVRDNFFDVGGHSLLAVKTIRRIDQAIGRTISVTTFFRFPTIERLAVILRRDAPIQSGTSIVPLQPNGSLPPFFVAAGVKNHIGDRLGPDQPVYRLVIQDLDQDQPFTRTEDMAKHCIANIKAVQSEGPYFLGGHCFGGVVAFEIARQLQEQGQKVALLVLFDAFVPGSRNNLLDTTIAHRLWLRTKFHADKLRRIGPKQEAAHLLRAIKSKTRESIWKIVGNASDPHAATYQARNLYVPKPFSGRAVLFQCSERAPWRDLDPENGWGDFITKGIDVYQIPGSHTGMYKEPQVEFMVERLRECLQRSRVTVFNNDKPLATPSVDPIAVG